MTFRDWWHTNEHQIASKHYSATGWSGAWLLLKMAYEAGKQEGLQSE